MNKISFGALALMLAASAACSSNDQEETPENTGTSKVKIRIENVKAYTGSRAVADPKGSTEGEKVEFANGYIFFVTPQGAIREHVKIIVDPNETDSHDCKKVNIEDLRKGYTFEGVSGDVTNVYVLANVTEDELHCEDLHNSNIRFIADLEQVKINIANQWQNDMRTVALSGNAQLYDSPEVGTKAASVQLVPLCARFEIPKITAGVNVLDYKVDGVYLAGFYEQMPLNQMCLQADWRSPNYEVANADAELAQFYQNYPYMADTEANGHVYSRMEDYYGTSKPVFYPVKPEADPDWECNKVWAYPFFGVEETSNPYTRHLGLHLIIKLSGLKVRMKDESGNEVIKELTENGGVRYLNIHRFVSGADAHSSAVRFYNGHVYQIKTVKRGSGDPNDPGSGDPNDPNDPNNPNNPSQEPGLEIHTDDISDKIMPTDINVEVEIIVKPWVVTPVYPVI